MRKRETIHVIWLASALVLSTLSSFITIPEIASAYTSHSPIIIMGNSEFTYSNGVVSGSGTSTDPFVIEGWDITGGGAFSSGIVIAGTTAFFVIKNVYAHSALFSGIVLLVSSNGKIQNCLSSSNTMGIWIQDSNNNQVLDCTVTNNDIGVLITGSTICALSDTNISSNNVLGLMIESCSSITAQDNQIEMNFLGGALIDSSLNSIFQRNNFKINDVLGLGLNNSANIQIKDNLFEVNTIGIDIEFSTNCDIRSNQLSSDAINMFGTNVDHFSSHTITSDNLLSDKPVLYYKNTQNIHLEGTEAGQIILANCQDIALEDLRFYNSGIPILLAFTDNSSIQSSIMSGCLLGIDLEFSNNTSIFNCEFTGNIWEGIYAFSSANCSIYENRISNNNPGINMESSIDCLIAQNNIEFNSPAGIILNESERISIYHNNIFQNNNQALDNKGSENYWDHGYPDGGNFWSDYSGTDGDLDGIGDTPYIIDIDSQDNYPLIMPIQIETPPLPTFKVSPSSGNPNDMFVFVSNSSDLQDPQNLLEIRWDWEGDGIWDSSWSTTKEATHQYSSLGEYTVRMEVRDTSNMTSNTTKLVPVIDNLPPITEIAISGTLGNDNWYVSPVNLTMNASDLWSDIQIISYCMDSTFWEIYDDCLECSDEGVHIFEYFSKDTSMNIEETQTLEFKIDLTAPTIILDLEQGAIVNSSFINITIQCDDNVSGVDVLQYCLDDGEAVSCKNQSIISLANLSDGNHQISIKAIDVAGNLYEKNVTFEVSTGKGISLEMLALITIPLVAIIAIVIALLMLRRRKGGPEATSLQSMEMDETQSIPQQVDSSNPPDLPPPPA